MRKLTIDRFMAKVDRASSDCWTWTAKRTRDGYGAFWNGEQSAKNQPVQVLAHRWAYEHFVGEIPTGMYVCHHCDNPSCVNPAHLFVGTQKQNVHDCIRKVRHRNARVALTAAQADAIRSEYQGRYGDLVRLARKYGASRKLIADVVHNQRAWA